MVYTSKKKKKDKIEGSFKNSSNYSKIKNHPKYISEKNLVMGRVKTDIAILKNSFFPKKTFFWREEKKKDIKSKKTIEKITGKRIDKISEKKKPYRFEPKKTGLFDAVSKTSNKKPSLSAIKKHKNKIINGFFIIVFLLVLICVFIHVANKETNINNSINTLINNSAGLRIEENQTEQKNYNMTSPMHYKMFILFDYKIAFLGYDINQTILHANDTFEITYYWKAIDEIDKDYVVFVHFTDEKGKILFQGDYAPEVKTTEWELGKVYKKTQVKRIPEELKSQYIYIQSGWYYPETGKRLNVDTADNRFLLLYWR